MDATKDHKTVSASETERPQSKAAPPRERIIAVARDLFYRQGIRAVGVEAIAEAASTNKMTLYRHFASKDELVAETMRELAEEADRVWDELAEAHPGDPKAQLLAWLGLIESDADSRGCALANAAVQLPDEHHPARCVIERFKRGQRERVAGLCRAAGLAEPELVADTLFLMLEGARVSLQSVGHEGPAAQMAALARNLIARHGG